ncbi:MAG: hypothetical protein U9Q82_03735, partial [Chloroflexota bacterium]|nr:hypothetical protein [Chloroflexota bacterium]
GEIGPALRNRPASVGNPITQVDFTDQPRINSMVLRNSEKASNRLKSTLPYETTLRRLAIQSTQVDFTDQPRINSMV